MKDKGFKATTNKTTVQKRKNLIQIKIQLNSSKRQKEKKKRKLNDIVERCKNSLT